MAIRDAPQDCHAACSSQHTYILKEAARKPKPQSRTMHSQTTHFIARREAQKEGSLAEKKLQRLESTRGHDVAGLRAELDEARTALREQLGAKDAKITSLVEELGNSQALLHDKEHELAQVRSCWEACWTVCVCVLAVLALRHPQKVQKRLLCDSK